MNDNLKRFLAQITEDKDWADDFSGIESREDAVRAALAKAAELGIPLSEADFDAPVDELSEDELQSVAGGGTCGCCMGGGGTKDGGSLSDRCSSPFVGCVDQVCACIVYGEGWADECNAFDGTYDEIQRCMCPMVGQGDSETTSYC